MYSKPQLYTKSNMEKISIFESEFESENAPKFLFANNPYSRLALTKKGNFDSATNVQLIVSNNHLILHPHISQKVSDNQVFGEVIEDFKQLLSQLEVNGRDSLNECDSIFNNSFALQNLKINADNGYYSNDTLEYIYNNQLNAILDTRLRIMGDDEVYLLSDEKIGKLGKLYYRKHLKYNPCQDRYYCFQNQPFDLTSIELIDNDFNMREGIPDEFLMKNFVYTNVACKNCVYKDECAGGEDFRAVTDKITTLNYNMRGKRHSDEGDQTYKHRWKTVETVFGYFKGADGVLRFISNDLIIVE
jgi:hypothetical protein